VVVSLLNAAAAACPPAAAAAPESLRGPRVGGVPAALLAKEAAYTAAAVGAYELHDCVDFTAWFRGPLLQVGRARGVGGGGVGRRGGSGHRPRRAQRARRGRRERAAGPAEWRRP
jgi:hypothetical protein